MLNRCSTGKYIWGLRRKIERCHSCLLKKIYSWRYRRILVSLGSYIPLSAEFCTMPCFPHGVSGIMISQGARIGKGCTILHQVTIGSNTFEDSKTYGAPTIGNNVYIGCGAKIIGGVKIGDNVRIGANCVIATDIPDNCTVVIEKPRIIKKGMERDNSYKNYHPTCSNGH